MKSQDQNKMTNEKNDENTKEEENNEGSSDDENTKEEENNSGDENDFEVKVISKSPSTPQSHHHLSKDQKCKLLDWTGNKNEVVAIGRWITDDPNVPVHGYPLGQGASRVWVDIVIQPKVLLFRSCFGTDTVEEIIGSTTAWPTDHIMPFED
ncbi:uncharacterized protein M6B38_157630 [Iris pallida]|uniref:DUF8039 domain-containing protein n=1 Tax=Iris pallida TaxID=29817 RepID=A0AAX6F1B2_IRIPA|nr:uncharacterized protein M6B38_157630 [Iris pallida]